MSDDDSYYTAWGSKRYYKYGTIHKFQESRKRIYELALAVYGPRSLQGGSPQTAFRYGRNGYASYIEIVIDKTPPQGFGFLEGHVGETFIRKTDDFYHMLKEGKAGSELVENYDFYIEHKYSHRVLVATASEQKAYIRYQSGGI